MPPWHPQHRNRPSSSQNYRNAFLCLKMVVLIEKDGICFLFYLASDGKASLESFILQPIRENICISLAANDIIIIYLYRNITEL